MGITPVHKAKLKKNLTVLGIIIGFMVLVWVITILKIKEYGVIAQ